MIALLTDFGLTDIYVGVMKGVMRTIHPQAEFVDITHDIQPQNVRQAGFALLNSYRYFPDETVFLVVVDPGVGSSRKPIAVQTGGCLFVAPDNGVLSFVLHEMRDAAIVELNNPTYQLATVSSTFHGRDIFAPAAAHLSKGVALRALGTPLLDAAMLPEPILEVNGERISGEVMHIDRFGNVTTSIGSLRWQSPERLMLNARFGDYGSIAVPSQEAMITIGGQAIASIRPTFAEVDRGEVLALVESSGYLEIAHNQGNCAERLHESIGDPVELQIG